MERFADADRKPGIRARQIGDRYVTPKFILACTLALAPFAAAHATEAPRGGVGLPPLPEARRLSWIDGAPARSRAKSIPTDMSTAELAIRMQPFIKADDGPSAQALLEATPGLSTDALTQWQQKVSWIYFLQGDDNNARAMAAKASTGFGDWAV